MRSLFFLSVLVITFLGCSSNKDSNPVSNEYAATGFVRASVNGVSWYSNAISTSYSGNTRYFRATQSIVNNPNFSSSILEFWISINQTGVFSIGEKDPGYTYAVRSAYTLKSASGTGDEIYKAHFQNYSFLTVSGISSSNLDAVFVFRAFTEDTLISVVVSDGVIKVDY
jgi:hypothetical protein